MERVFAMKVIHRYTYIDHYEESDSDDSRMVNMGSSKMQIKLFCMTTFKHKATSKSFCTHSSKLLRHGVIQITDADQKCRVVIVSVKVRSYREYCELNQHNDFLISSPNSSIQ